MDLNVRCWDDGNSLVKLNCVTSRFFQCPNAENILSELLAGLKVNMIQLSMDGPNANWKVFDPVQRHQGELEYFSLSNLGSCGLHMVHGAFKAGAQESVWGIHKIFKAMWNIFQDEGEKRTPELMKLMFFH